MHAYPLTPWSLDPARLLAFQFHDRASGDGIVQAFCGSGATNGVTRLRLRGLGPTSRNVVTNWDGPAQISSFTGVQ